MLKKFWQKFQYRFKGKLKREASRPYIVPTRAGFVYAVFCFFMISLGFLYDNNLLYLQGFFLASIGIVTMHATNKNLSKLKVELKELPEAFAQEEAFLSLVASSELASSREVVFKNSHEELSPLNVEKQNPTEFKVKMRFSERGVQQMEPIEGASFYPFRFLYTWKYYLPLKEILVYPRKLQWPFLQLDADGAEMKTLAQAEENIDFWGHRPWQASESFRRIDYKIKAKTGLLLSQDLRSTGAGKLNLSFSDTPKHMSFEDRISVLTYWVSLAIKKKKDFTVEINNFRFEPGNNVKDVKAIYQKLALIEDFTL